MKNIHYTPKFGISVLIWDKKDTFFIKYYQINSKIVSLTEKVAYRPKQIWNM